MNSGLAVMLYVDPTELFCLILPVCGFSVLLHNPNEGPDMNFGITVGSGFETHITYSPIRSEASDNVRHLSPSIRQCYFQNENFLKLYR